LVNYRTNLEPYSLITTKFANYFHINLYGPTERHKLNGYCDNLVDLKVVSGLAR